MIDDPTHQADEAGIQDRVSDAWDTEVGPGDKFTVAAPVETPPSSEPAHPPAAPPQPGTAAAAPPAPPSAPAETSTTAPAPAAASPAPTTTADNGGDILARLSALEQARQQSAPTAPAAAPAAAAEPAPTPEPEPEPLPGAEAIQENLGILEGMLQDANAKYQAADTRAKTIAADWQKKQDELREIMEDLADPGPNTDAVDLEHKRNRLAKKIATLEADFQRASSEANGWAHHYHFALKPQHTSLQATLGLLNDLASRDNATREQARTQEVNGYRDQFFGAARSVAEDAAVIPPELKDLFLGTPQNGFKDGWIRRHGLAHLSIGPDGRTINTIENYPVFMKEAARVFLEEAKAKHAAWSAYFAKQRNGTAIPAGSGTATAPAPATTPQAVRAREDEQAALEEAIDSRWDAEVPAGR